MFYQDKFLKALVEINSDNFNERDWLKNNFELYKESLYWPINLPPLKRGDSNIDSVKIKFFSTYEEILSNMIMNSIIEPIRLELNNFQTSICEYEVKWDAVNKPNTNS